MRVEIPRLHRDGEWFEGVEPGEVLKLGDDVAMAPAGEISYRLFVQAVSDELVVSGEVRMALRFVCARCAETFVCEVADSEFVRAYELAAATEFVDLTDDIREAIILALPANPLCRSDCKGLCHACGANLNEGACMCGPSPGDRRWEALGGVDWT